jgi:hypothetical protein
VAKTNSRHANEFWIFFVADGGAWLEGHAADGAGARFGADDFGMHGTGVFDLRGQGRAGSAFESHAAFWTGSGVVLADFGVHRADEFGGGFGRRCGARFDTDHHLRFRWLRCFSLAV